MQKIYKEDLVELINEIQHPIWIYDLKTNHIIRVNKSTIRLLGYSAEELMGMKVFDLRNSEEVEYYNSHNEWKTYTLGLNKFYKLRKKNGEEVFAEIHYKDISYKKSPARITTVYDLTERINNELKLKQIEERFRVSQEISLDAFTIMNPVYDLKREIIDFTWEYVNPAAAKILKFPPEELVGQRLLQKLPGNNIELFELYKNVVTTGTPHDIEIRYDTDNIEGWFRNMTIKLGDGIAVTFHDITQRKLQQDEIESKNREMHDVFERISDAFIAIDKNWNLKYANNTALKILNSDRSVIGKNFWEAFPIYKKPMGEIFSKAMMDLQPKTIEMEGLLTPRWYRVTIFPSSEGLTVYSIDITLSKAYEEQLMNSLKEKELLLKEVHHRIKNNLQIIISILNLQSYYINDSHALEIFKQSQNRIRSMALIHEKLYKTESLSSINLESYVKDITKYLLETYLIKNDKIEVKFDMDDIELDSNAAISFGLIVNELFSNSIKYAFPGNQAGTIIISAKLLSKDLVFQVFDNGVGMPEGIDFRNTNSLGLQLVNTLSDQLNGRVDMTSKEGTKFTLVVPISTGTHPGRNKNRNFRVNEAVA